MKKFVCCVLSVFLFSSLTAVNALGDSAKASAVINADTGEVIYSKNAGEKLPMASTTKIMTALLLCENGDFEKEITVSADMLKVEGSSMGLLPGDRVSYRALLYGLLLASGNDAANVTAITLGGSLEEFAKLMNDKAAELGLSNTHFVTPSGLDADGHYTTALDLAQLARCALKNEEFKKAASSETATLYYGNPPYRRSLKNHNRLLKMYDDVIGVKTGFTKKSGRCLVSAAQRDGKTAVAVTLNDPNDWDDHRALLNYGLDNIKQTEYKPKTDTYNIPVIGTDEDLCVSIYPFTVNTLETEGITSVVRLPKFMYPPIKKGETVGSIEYKMGDTVLGTVPLTAVRDIAAPVQEPPLKDKILRNIKYILKNI